LFAPVYAPHLEAYIDGIVQFGDREKWTRLKSENLHFPNDLVRYLLIRALSSYNRIAELREALREYLDLEPPSGNLELAFYAAKAGFEPSVVTAIAGTIEIPKADSPDYISPSDPTLKLHAYSFIVVGYEGNEEFYETACSAVTAKPSLWASALHHLLKAGYCIGKSLHSNEADWYGDAVDSVSILVEAESSEGERIGESIDLIRDVLHLSIGLLTESIEKRFPERLRKWMTALQQLRDSLLWTTHFGIGEFRRDYHFELRLWDLLAKNPSVRPWLIPILESCAVTYEGATTLKGGDRASHFMLLAATMAKCGMRKDSEKWLLYGIQSSLIYGYHKDGTILNLIDVLKLINQRQPAMALERCARVLSMVRWMPDLTDGRGTERFLEKVFEAVLENNRNAAFDLLKHFLQKTGRWQMQDCLESYLLSTSEGDPEYLWCLTESFANHYSEDGRHCGQIMRTRQHIVDLVQQSCPEDVFHDFEDRFRHFVLTEIPPRHWPKELKRESDLSAKNDSEERKEEHAQPKFSQTYSFDGQAITKEDIVNRCRVSFHAFVDTIDKLKEQNTPFYEPYLIETILRHHIGAASCVRDLFPIKEYVESQGRHQRAELSETLAERFLEYGDRHSAIACFGHAYACFGSWSRWLTNRKYLEAVADANPQVAWELVLRECYDSARESTGGYDTPPIAATGLDVLDEAQMLDEAFSDFLSHCETMFAQLPQNHEYDWLKRYKAPSKDENNLILDFVIDELDASEIDLGERLVRALTRLALARPDYTIPHMVNASLESSGRTRRRLLIVLSCIAIKIPGSLAPHQRSIASLLNVTNFFCRQIVLKILKRLADVSDLDESVIASINNLETAYSHIISNSAWRLPTNPSSEFSEFLEKYTLHDFSRQIKLLEKILRVCPGSLVAAIEERLEAQKWSILDEGRRIKDEWEGHIHPQGWPVVWITTDFQEQVADKLLAILDEAVQKFKLTKDQIDWMWQAIQPADPEYMIHRMSGRPQDIYPLRVSDKNAWFHELKELDSINIAKFGPEQTNQEWITVFEKRQLAQEEQYNVPYRNRIVLTSALIPQQVYGSIAALGEVDFVTEQMAYTSLNIAVALEQARAALLQRTDGDPELNRHESIPIIAVNKNPDTFWGYDDVCSLASFIIKAMGLYFVNFDLFRDMKQVTKYDAWQEGYQDEPYTRDKLSFGIRLQVRQEFLSEICRRYNRLLCIYIQEERFHFNSIHDQKPNHFERSRRYNLFHL